ncbi:Blp family class II bacteriocin [Clostridium grantii]|uniref:Bacteriocin-type signal sequence-containing protein n=1 Tax=Clostridium grantii DSM 8605 TaxID=1121316 RepID=A0A1M5YAE9_9CLOT|nr:bacteriocin [Clostridium grantii]SHI09061.1 bacteriocin-type signal sequence-containing protein [Clostridium grantii DSM 8605]
MNTFNELNNNELFSISGGRLTKGEAFRIVSGAGSVYIALSATGSVVVTATAVTGMVVLGSFALLGAMTFAGIWAAYSIMSVID